MTQGTGPTKLSELLRALLNNPRVVAVGETGLDFNRNYSSREDQIRAFEAQLEIAMDIQKPLFLHERDAFETQIEILQHLGNKLPPVVIHCFTGNRESLEAYLDCGFLYRHHRMGMRRSAAGVNWPKSSRLFPLTA
ncbi:MAG: TatD family hydrolase [Porticoccaceae bacterium]